jgi:hypothetical protein
MTASSESDVSLSLIVPRFRTYLTTEAGELLPWTLNETLEIASAVERFVELVSWEFLDGYPFLIWAVFGDNYLACHWCRSRAGDSDICVTGSRA